MRKDLTPLTKDKLLVVLSLEDVINQLNTALRARKATLTVDFTQNTPRLFVEMPGLPKHLWMEANPRTRLCLAYHSKFLDLEALIQDIISRLAKFDAHLTMGVKRMKKTDALPICKLMVIFRDSNRVVLGLMHATKHKRHSQQQFLIPEAFKT